MWRGPRRRDRNRQTALATYYRRKAEVDGLQAQIAGLERDRAALLHLETAVHGASEYSGARGAGLGSAPVVLQAPARLARPCRRRFGGSISRKYLAKILGVARRWAGGMTSRDAPLQVSSGSSCSEAMTLQALSTC